jgi:translation initiation factor RLI1
MNSNLECPICYSQYSAKDQSSQPIRLGCCRNHTICAGCANKVTKCPFDRIELQRYLQGLDQEMIRKVKEALLLKERCKVHDKELEFVVLGT